MSKRKIVKIDEEKCTGCGLCVPSCAEGAIQIIDGKARLVSDVYCDGLGACLGECPEDAITVEEREADAFDEAAVEKHLAQTKATEAPKPAEDKPFQCPGSAMRDMRAAVSTPPADTGPADEPSALQNWPVQLHLAPTKAPYFDGARLVIAADCVPFAYASFHKRFLQPAGNEPRTLLICCPKLDEVKEYERKLIEIFRDNEVQAIDVIYMEVPCCFGLVHLVRQTLQASGKDIPLRLVKIGIQGGILEEDI